MKTSYLFNLFLILEISQLVGVSAEAARANLTCSATQITKTSLSITFNESNYEEVIFGNFQYSEHYVGAYPTNDEFSGPTSGTLSNTSQGIEARFDFKAFGVPSQLIVHQSVGQIAIGQGANQNVGKDMACSLNFL